MITLPERVPDRISPCPIVEAIFEMRFVTTEPWATLPGLLFARIRNRFPEQVTLPLTQVPESLRAQDPALQYLPLLQFRAEAFLVQLGPRVVSLVTKQYEYPGWSTILATLGWLLEEVATAQFVREVERLGVRYVDFFNHDVFSDLRLDVYVDGQPLAESKKDLSTILRFDPISARLHVTNGAIATSNPAKSPQLGSILDIDGWLGPTDIGPISETLGRFTELHATVKRLFFALLKPDYLSQLSPAYP